MPTLSIERREIAAQPALFVRRTTARRDLAETIRAGFGTTFEFARTAGAAMAGPPFVRYPAMSEEQLTIEAGMPVAARVAGVGDVKAGELTGGPVLVGLHAGPYDQLRETFSAMERWAAEHGATLAGAPWESYLTDPHKHPDTAEWRTEVVWPLTR